MDFEHIQSDQFLFKTDHTFGIKIPLDQDPPKITGYINIFTTKGNFETHQVSVYEELTIKARRN